MNAPRQEQPEERFLDTIIGVFTNPVPTLSGVVRRRPIANAFIVIIVLSIAQGLVQAVSLDPAGLGDAEELAAWVQGFAILASPVVGIVVVALTAGVFWLMSRILGGSGEYGAMFTGIGFASAPYILQSLIGFLAIPLGDGADALIGILELGVGVWITILAVIVVRECNQFSTGRASAAVLIPIAAFTVFVIVVVAVYTVVFAAAVGLADS